MDEVEFGRYRLISLIGRGGMGEVWRAHDTATDRVVAIKVLPQHLADDETFKARFRREAHSAARLDSPHVVPIYDYGEIDGRLYVTMRLINGRDLQTILADGPLSAERAVRIIEQVAQAVHAAHKVGLVHRDIKPSNILLDDNDYAYLIDFGIARAAGETGLTSTGAAIGTWAYMAPERFQAGTPDARADIYALACVLYECLTGRTPFTGDDMARLVAAHLTTPPPQPSTAKPDLPPQLDEVVATGMAKDPDQRYATTVELARAARDATTVPLTRAGPTRPDHLAADPFQVQDTQLAATGAAPVLPPPAGPLPEAQPGPMRPGWRRPRVVVPAMVAVVLLIGGGIFAGVKVSQPHGNTPTIAAPPPAPPPNTGPFTGTYTADLGPETDLDGRPVEGATPATQTWGVRSVCRPSGCVATAKRLGGDTVLPTLVFDDVGGRWVSVGLASGTCNNVRVELWAVLSLQPHPDGTLAGDRSTTSNSGCNSDTRAVTLTRTGDVDVASILDPASLPPRVVSPAEALHGRYHQTRTFTAPAETQEYDLVVRTDCLRGGDRCMSYFHGADAKIEPLVFGGGKWTEDDEYDSPCPSGGTSHMKRIVQFPLPAPPQDPITLLAGHGRQEETGSACVGGDFDEKFVRTGD